MFLLASSLMDPSAPGTPPSCFEYADTSLTYLWVDKSEKGGKEARLRKKRGKFRRCLQSSIFSSLLVGLLLSINTILVKNAPDIPTMEFVAASGLGSWVLCLGAGGLTRVLWRQSVHPLFGNLGDFPRLLLAGGFRTLSTVMLYFAVQRLAVMEALTLYYLYPLFFSILGAMFYGATCGYQTMVGGCICVMGGVAVGIPWKKLTFTLNLWQPWGRDRRTGVGLGVLSGVAAAVAYLLSGGRWDSRTPDRFSHPVPMALWTFQIQALAGILFLLVGWPDSMVALMDLETKTWVWLLLLVLFSAAERLLASWVVTNKTKSFVIVLEAIHVVWASVGTFIVIEEIPEMSAFVGGTLMIIGISILSLQAQHRDDDMEDWNLEDDPGAEGVFQTTSTMFSMDLDAWA